MHARLAGIVSRVLPLSVSWVEFLREGHMCARLHGVVGLVLCVAGLGSSVAVAQHEMLEPPSQYIESIPLYTVGLGPFTRPISSTNAEAQAYFNQGFQMMYAFAKVDAVRSFRETWKRDDNCAICYWGEAWAWGSYLNGPMSAEEAPHAYAAIQKASGKDYAKLTGDTVYQVLTLLRFGRFDEILAVTSRPADEVTGGLWDFAQGYAYLRQGDVDFAELYLARVVKTAENSTADFRRHSAKHLLGTVAGVLEGEIQREAGDMRAAVVAFERAVAREDALVYDEPEPLPFAARHWLGAALLEMNRFEDAERVYREELADHPQ
jgi:tetratricopeptide (TPR) repeat protein